MHKFQKERRRNSRHSWGCFECRDITHFITDCPKSEKYDYSNKNDYNNKNDYKKKNRFGDKKKKNINNIMSRACATLSDFDFSSKDLSSSEDDEKVNYKKKECDFPGLCLMTKRGSSRNDSDSDVSDDLTYDGLSSKVHKLEDALCSQDKLLCRVFCENKDLNLKLENSFPEIASLWSMHNDMSAQLCKNYNMIMVNYADLWIVHTQVASQLKGAKLELKELKARSLLLGACLEYPKLKLELDARSLKVKELETKLLEKPRVSVTSPPCEVCGTLKGKIFHATKENSELKQEVAYLSRRLERTKLNEKMIEDDLIRVEKSATKSTYKLGVAFERCEDKGEKSAPQVCS
jgi:hypothetical protein